MHDLTDTLFRNSTAVQQYSLPTRYLRPCFHRFGIKLHRSRVNFEPKVALDRMYYDPTDTLFIRHLDLIDRMNMLAREP